MSLSCNLKAKRYFFGRFAVTRSFARGVPSEWQAISIVRVEYNQLKNNEFLVDAEAATSIGKAANGKQLPLFAGGDCLIKNK